MKIALVGNGKLSKKYGNKIDKCDMVIRFNHAQISGYEDYIGTKTNVLGLINPVAIAVNEEFDKIDKYILKNCEYIIFSGRSRNEDYENKILECRELQKGRADNIFTYIDYSCYSDFCNRLFKGFKLTKNPSTGINVLCYIIYLCDIIHNLKNKLYLFGFDNFKTGHYFDANYKRNNAEFHDIPIANKLLKRIKNYKNIFVFN